MTQPVFSITPGSAKRPAPVHLSLPSSGYSATAGIADVCGRPIPGASVSVVSMTATPHLPASYDGTFLIEWKITRNGPGSSGLGVSMTLAAREDTNGKTTTCPQIRPAAAAPHATVSIPPHGASGVTVAQSHGTDAGAIIGWVVLVVAAGAALGLWLRRQSRSRRPKRGAKHGA
jgi:hypothetical protein